MVKIGNLSADQTPDAILLRHPDDNGNYLNYAFDFVRFEDGYIRNVSWGPFETLRITAQNDRSRASKTTPSYPGDGLAYAWTVGYEKSYSGTTLENFEERALVLGKIKRGMAKLADEFGYPENFATYVIRAATALGIKRFLIPSEWGGWTYESSYGNKTNWREGTGSDAHYWIGSCDQKYRLACQNGETYKP